MSALTANHNPNPPPHGRPPGVRTQPGSTPGACSAVVVDGSVPVQKRRLEGIPGAFLYVVEAHGERLAWVEIERKGEVERFVPARL